MSDSVTSHLVIMAVVTASHDNNTSGGWRGCQKEGSACNKIIEKILIWCISFI